jgi:hypothetical protein
VKAFWLLPLGLGLLLTAAWFGLPTEASSRSDRTIFAPNRTPTDIQPGDVLIENHDIPSAASCGPEADGGAWRPMIQFLFSSGYQHVRLALSPNESLENLATGIARTPIAARNLGQFELWRPRCDATLKRRAMAAVGQRLGEPFGVVQGGLLVLHKRFRLDTPDVDGMTCSELIARAYAEAGYPLTGTKKPHQVAPWDFREPVRLTRVW